MAGAEAQLATPPPKPRNPTAEAIAERAAELFARHGFAGTSIRAIAEAAGVTKPTLYYHFDSKDGLIRYILSSCFAHFDETLQICRTADHSFADALRDLAQARLEFADTHPATLTLLFRIDLDPPPEVKQLGFDAQMFEARARWVEIFAEAIARGEIRAGDASFLADAFVGLLLVQLALRLRVPQQVHRPAADVARDVVELFFDGARSRIRSPALREVTS